VLGWRILGFATGITGKETRPMRALIDASLTTIFTTMSCGGVKQIFLGIALAYISKRKRTKICEIECSYIARASECIVRFTPTVFDDLL
jgi:hypothetical protein